MNRHKIRNVAPLLLLAVVLLTAIPSSAEETRTVTNLKGEQVTVPHIVPAREDLALLKMVVVKMETSNGQGGQVKVAQDKNLTDPNAKAPAKVLVMDADDKPGVEQPARLHL